MGKGEQEEMRSYEKYLLVDELPVIYRQPKETVPQVLKQAGLDITDKELDFDKAAKVYRDWATKSTGS